MAVDIYQRLVEEPQSMIKDLTASEWPMDLINEFAFEFVPQGKSISLISQVRIDFDMNDKNESIKYRVGYVAINGFFRGYTDLSISARGYGAYNAEEVLAMRIDDASNKITFLPLNQISSIEVGQNDPMEFLGENNETLKHIDEVINKDEIDFVELSRIFGDMDMHQIETELYLDYLNQNLRLGTKILAMLVNSYFVIVDNNYGTHKLNTPEIVSLDEGRSFSLVGVDYGNNDTEAILCVNVLTPHNTYARVRPDYILSVYS